MNREIKFRAWDGAKMHNNVSPWRWDFVISNTWHRCEKATGTGIFGIGGDTAEFLVPGVRFSNLMQYTGLKDKNGTEIYEGDLVKVREHLVDGKDYIDYSFEVRHGAWCYCLFIADKQIKPLDSIFARGCEVVGNVHMPKTPHLINHPL